MIRYPSRDQDATGPVLQRLQEFEAKTEQRLEALEKKYLLVSRVTSAVTALSEEHKSFDRFRLDTTAQLQAQREHFQGRHPQCCIMLLPSD
jgi:hypothetical protein